MTPLLELRGIRKTFGSVVALDGADFALAAGEVHALVGENGAGKTTLMHIAYGMLTADAGAILVDGREVAPGSPRGARRLGIGMVHQHFTSIDGLTVRENISLAVGPRPPAPRSGVAARLREGLDPQMRAGDLSVAQRQRLEILKALDTGARILLLDEPTALLASAEVDELLSLVRTFVAEGGSVVLITHKLREVLAVADRVTVLRRGRVTLRGAAHEFTERTLAEAMIGTLDLASGGVEKRSREAIRKVTVRIGEIELRAGELIGIAAVEGNGQRELLRAIAGLAAVPGVEAMGKVAFVPEDRMTEGLIAELSVAENVVLGLGDDPRWVRGIRLDWRAARNRTTELIEEFRIKAPGPDARTGGLSGGNQQKIVLARALEAAPQVLVAENPTRGLDVRTAAEVQRRFREAAASGVTVIVYSTDLDEVLALAERVLVVWKGVVREAPTDAGRAVVGEITLGVEPRDRTAS